MTRVRTAVAAIAVVAMTLGVAAPAGAQEEEGPASLGFAVDKTQAEPGALVLGKADPGDVAEHCTTTVEEFQERFAEQSVVLNDEAFWTRYWDPEPPFPIVNHEQLAWWFTAFVVLGLQLDFGGAAQDALPQTFVMTFADIETQEPVGEMGNFDRNTGEGSVVVPDIEPGLWAVAAACVGPVLDHDRLDAGIRAIAAFLEEIGAPADSPDGTFLTPELEAFMQDFVDSDATGFTLLGEFLGVVGPDIVANIVEPDAFGAVLFCILDDQGNCPADEEPEPPPGEPAPPPSEEPAPAVPVVAAPTFTG